MHIAIATVSVWEGVRAWCPVDSNAHSYSYSIRVGRDCLAANTCQKFTVNWEYQLATVVLQNLAKILAHARNFMFKMNGKFTHWLNLFARFCKTAVASGAVSKLSHR